MRVLAAGLLMLAFSGLTLASAAERAPLTAETMWAMQRIGSPVLSPDGRTAVAPVTRYDVEENKGHTDLWMFAVDGSARRPLTTHASSEGSPVFSPDGRWLAFVAQRDEDKAPQIYVLPMAGGEALRVTSLRTGASAPKWFGDSQRIAFVSLVWPDLDFEAMAKKIEDQAKSKISAKVWDQAPVTSFDRWVDDREAHVYVTDRDGATPQAWTLGSGFALEGEGGASAYDVDPRADRIAFVADTDPSVPVTNLDVYLLDGPGKTPRLLTADNTANDASPLFAPDGRSLAFLRQTIPGFYADTRRLMIVDLASGALRQISPDWDRSAGGLVWAPDGRSLYGSIDDAGTTRVYRLPLNGAPQALTGEGSHGSIALAGDRQPVMVGLRESFHEPPTLVRIDLRNGNATKLSDFNDEILANIDFGRYESVSYRGANDAEIQMWVNYPPGFDEQQRWPLVMLVHGGPHNAITNGWSWRWHAQAFAARGYVAAWPNFHGSSGFGQAFADSITRDWATLPYEDVIKASEWFAEKPWIDADRMVTAGASYGGYLTSLILGREHPFKSFVIHAAVYNLYTQGSADYAWGAPRYGEYWLPEVDAVVRTSSPHFGAANFSTPTLVIHGQLDYRVPLSHGLELFQTLQRLEVESRLIYYPDENHWILKPQNSIFWYGEVLDWLGKGAEPGPR